jgi:hypothetical protein
MLEPYIRAENGYFANKISIKLYKMALNKIKIKIYKTIYYSF